MIVLAAATVAIVATILFGMNGVWALHLTTQQAEESWDQLATHFLVDVPAAMQAVEEEQQRVLQREYGISD